MFSDQDLKKLIGPLIIEQILAVAIGMADTVMVSTVGQTAVSGVSLVDTINILLINILAALATGGAVVASQYLGKRDEVQARVAAKQLVIFCFFFASAITVLTLIFRNMLLHTIFGNVEADVMRNAQIYFFISALSYPFLALYNSGAALFRSMGNSKISMKTSLVMNVFNVCGNALLIYVFKLGVAGAAIASLAARALGAVVMLYLLRDRHRPIYIENLLKLEFHFPMIKSILRIGIPNGLENGMFQIGKILVQGLIASYGTTAIAANAVANSIGGIQVLPGAAIGLAMVTVVGQCVGARDYEAALLYTKKLMKTTYKLMIGLNIFLILTSRLWVSFYLLPEETTNLAIQLLLCHGLGCIFIWPLAFTLPSALRASNDVKFTMTISVLSMWVFRVGTKLYYRYYSSGGCIGRLACHGGGLGLPFVILCVEDTGRKNGRRNNIFKYYVNFVNFLHNNGTV